MTQFVRIARAAAVLALVVTAVGCGKKGNSPLTPTASPTLIGVEIVGKQIYVVGETAQLQAVAKYSDGTTQQVAALAEWDSFNSGAIDVAAGGLLTALKVGKCGVVATFQGVTGKLPVEVVEGDPTPPGPDPGDDATLVGLAVQGAATVAVGETVAWRAIALFSDGGEQNVTAASAWSSAAPGTATVDGAGVTGVSPGQTAISAAYEGYTASGGITVTEPGYHPPTVTSLTVAGNTAIEVGGTTQLQATAHFSDGTTQSVTTAAAWSSSAPSVASVVGGLVSGHAAGSAPITATYSGQSASVTVQVSAGTPAATIAITGPACSVVGQTAQLTATVDGQNVTAQVAWSTDNGSVATVSAVGLLSCAGVGSTTVRATLAPHNPGSLPVTVTAAPADLIGLEVHVAGDVLTGSGPLGLGLDFAELLNGNPLLDLTVYALYSDGSKVEVTSLATVNCPTVPNPVVPCLVGLDGYGTIELVALLLQGLIDPTHPINVTYGGYTANLVVTLQLPVLQEVAFTNAGPINLSVGNQLPSLQGVFTQGITSTIDATTPSPTLTHGIQLADGLLTQLGAVPIIGPLLIGPLTTQINQVLAGLTVDDGALVLSPALTATLNDILDNDLFEALGLTALPIDVRATVNGVTSDPVRVNLGS